MTGVQTCALPILSLADHLYELRNRLAKSFLAIGLGMALVGFVIYQPVFDFLREPYCRTSAAGDALASAQAAGPVRAGLPAYPVGTSNEERA